MSNMYYEDELIDYPEHTKLCAIPNAERLAIGQFLEWLESQRYTICQWRDAGTNGEPEYLPATPEQLEQIAADHGPYSWEESQARRHGIENVAYESWPEGFYPVRDMGGIEGWLARYFEIDLKRLYAEKEQMYQRLRAATDTKG